MAFTTQGVKATWQNPQTVPDAQKQPGGWYFNPATGSVDRWFPDAQSGGSDSSLANTAGSLVTAGKSTSPSDYFSQAMSYLQPSINAQTAPLKEQQTLIPQLFEQTKQQLGQQEMAQAGQQRATAAAQGITSTSGVEQSQEANIAQNFAQKMAVLPVQEAQALTTLASQIAQIEGGGVQQAMNYAADLAKMASDELWKEANYSLSADRLAEAKRYHDLSLSLKSSGAGTEAERKQSIMDQAKQDIIKMTQQGVGNLFPKILAMYSGQLTPDEIGTLYNSVQAGLGKSGYGPYKETPQQLGLQAASLPSTQPKGAPTTPYAQYQIQQLNQDVQNGSVTSMEEARRRYPDIPTADIQTILDSYGKGGASGILNTVTSVGGTILRKLFGL